MNSASIPRNKKSDPVQRMIANKKKLISRLHDEIKATRANAEEEVERIQFRIRQATVILQSLEKGSLKP